MDKIIEAAGALGRLIANTERFRRLRIAEEAINADAATKQLLRSFEAKRDQILELEHNRSPVEPELKREMQRLSDEVHANAPLQELAHAQADYMEMMNRVNKAIRAAMDEGEEKTAVAGNGRDPQ